MTTKTRLYRVVTPTSKHLVESTSPQRAVAHVAGRQIQCDIPAQHEVYAMAKDGVEIEKTSDQPISDATRNAVAQADLAMA